MLHRPRHSLALLSLVLCACGGGDDDDGPSSGQLFDGYGTSELSLPVLLESTPLSPVDPDPSIQQYTVEPALPAGLELDRTSGVLSGTPTALSAPKKYEITAEGDNVQDVEAITIEVRGPLVGLDSDLELVRSFASAGSPAAFTTGGLTSATAAVATTTPALTPMDVSQAPADAVTAPSGAPTVDAGAVPGGQDATGDFVATVTLDTSELSADPWTFAVQPPYADDGITVTVPSFAVDTSSVVIEDAELQLGVELASEGLGPFDSTALRTERLDFEPVTTSAEGFSSDWIGVGGVYYLVRSSGGQSELARFDPDAGGGPALEQVADLSPVASDDADVLAVFGDWLMVHLRAAGGALRLYAYHTIDDVLVEVCDQNPAGDFLALELEELDGSLYLTSAESTPAEVILRWTPPDGATPALLERVSATAANANDSDEAGDLIALGGKLYFLATDSTRVNLYRFDPSTSTQERLSPDALADVVDIDDADGDLYAIAAGGAGLKVYGWDEGSGALEQVADLTGPAGDDDPEIFDELDGGLHFSALLPSGVRKLLRYDPSVDPPSLEQLTDIAGELANDVIGEVLRVGDTLFLVAENENAVTKLYAYDYATGTQLQVADINGATVADAPDDLVARADGRVLLALDDAAAGGFALYLADPATRTLTLLADPFGSGVDDDVFTLASDGARVYFSAWDGAQVQNFVIE